MKKTKSKNMKNTKTVSFFLGWNDVEQKYIDVISIQRESLMYLVEKGKISAKNLEDLPKVITGDAVIIPEGINDGKAIIHIFTETPIPQNWLSSQDLLKTNASLMPSGIIKDKEKKNIEFSFSVERDEVEIVDKRVVVIVF